ncbi:MAG: phage major tail tube protein [Candidatus Binataceae bacterium]
MAGPLTINSLTNASVYLDGVGFIGRAAEVEVPHPKHKMIDYKGLGMAGSLELWAGIDKLEMQIKWSSFDPIALAAAADGISAHSLQIRGSVRVMTSQGVSAELPAVYLATGTFKDGGKAAFKHQELVETTSKLAVSHVELWYAGEQVFLYDAFANLYSINGVDQLAQFRANLGG